MSLSYQNNNNQFFDFNADIFADNQTSFQPLPTFYGQGLSDFENDMDFQFYDVFLNMNQNSYAKEVKPSTCCNDKNHAESYLLQENVKSQLLGGNLANLDALQYDQPQQESPKIEAQVSQEISPVIDNEKATKKIKKQKKDKKPKKEYPEKNVHRYFTRAIISYIKSNTFADKVEKLCQSYDLAYDNLINYLNKNLEKFQNLQHLCSHWLVEENVDEEQQKINSIFLAFSKWFLKNKATRYVLTGRMKNKQIYIQYINDVLSTLILNPKSKLSLDKQQL